VETFVMRRAPARETHGTGCVFSAALAALLAGGASLPAAVPRAQRFVAAALSAARPVGRHYPLRIAPPR
jgi:hydroxymethylpyrimidine/phosphomethylpyrimidine kinase